MYEADIIAHFSKVPVFSLADASQIIKNREYAKKALTRMAKTKRIMRIKKDLYTFHNDTFLISTFLVRPSYISGASALSYHKAITQIPNEVFCITAKPPKSYFFVENIRFHNTKFFFGFEVEEHLGFKVPVATIEKALIDSIGYVPISVIEEAFDNVNIERMIEYLKKIKKSSTAKRIGYLLEAHGHDVFGALKKYMDKKYIPLDSLVTRKGEKNRKWHVII